MSLRFNTNIVFLFCGHRPLQMEAFVHVAFRGEGSSNDLSFHSRLICRKYRSFEIKPLPTSPIGRDPPATIHKPIDDSVVLMGLNVLMLLPQAGDKGNVILCTSVSITDAG